MNIFPKCSLCGKVPRNGLYDGFRLNRKFICSDCEEHIVRSGIGSLDYYKNICDIRAILYS